MEFMEFAYEPPKAFERLAPKRAARTQLGWGVGEDGSIDLEHVMSSNPFAGKTHNWGVATIDQNGDIIIQSKGPGNAESEHQLPPELIQKIVQFYEGEGLNVRNIAEKTADFADEHLAPSLGPDVPEGMCPICRSSEVYGVPGSPFVDCDSCGWHGDSTEVLDGHENPDPDDRAPDSENYNYNQDFITDAKTAGVSLQGAPVTGANVVTGIVIRPDLQTEEQARAMLAQMPQATEHDNLKRYVDERNKGQGTSFPTYDNPYTNRGGSLISEKIEDHFIEEQPNPKEAADPIGIPATGPNDPRNFQPRRDAVIVAKNLITDHAWAYLDKDFNVKGIVTELGGASSHAAQIAMKENMALIVGIPVDGIGPGDTVVMNPKHGTVDVNGGSNDVQKGDTTLKHEAARFVWSNGHHMATPFGEPEADTHIGMIMNMATIGLLELDEQSGEPVNATRGVVYDSGAGEYYDEIRDVDAMTAWAHQTYPQMKSMEYKPTGTNYQVAAKIAEIIESAPKCPKCGSHSYKPVTLPSKSDGKGEGELNCLSCGENYKAELYRNPKKSTTMDELFQQALPLAQAAEDSQQGFQSFVQELKGILNQKFGVDVSGGLVTIIADHAWGEAGKTLAHSPLRAQSSLEKLAPGKEHMKGVSPKRNRQYEHILESVQKEHPEWSLEKQKEYAARTVNKQREEKGETKSSKVADTDGNPLEAGRLYLMHSVKYKVPDVIQLVKVEPNGVEAHIESDINGSFPILISHDEFDEQGYSFEPYGGSDDLPSSTSKVAAHKIHLTPRRQQELISENMGGRARNFDKLNLEGTHYEHKDYEIVSTDDLSAYFLF